MIELYDMLIDGISKQLKLDTNYELPKYLNQIKSTVRDLRLCYRNFPVSVPYHREEYQTAYLLTYFPHYVQLINKILTEDCYDTFKGKESLKLTFFGGGPGPEILGTMLFIKEHYPQVKSVDINLFDINASAWDYSHRILCDNVLSELGLNFNFSKSDLDFTKGPMPETMASKLTNSDLVVFQNCLNEISVSSQRSVKELISQVFDKLNKGCTFIIADLASNYPEVIRLITEIENIASYNYSVDIHRSIAKNNGVHSMVSLFYPPTRFVIDNLLTGESGLIPRKNLKYNYSCFTINKTQKLSSVFSSKKALDLLYSPLATSVGRVKSELVRKTFIGIDFGTSTTVCSYVKINEDNQIITESIPIKQYNERNKATTHQKVDSVVAYDNNRIIIGKPAKDLARELVYGKNYWSSFKMGVGVDLGPVYYNSDLRVGEDKILTPEDACVKFFQKLKVGIDSFIEENNLPMNIEYAISIPASFEMSQRQSILYALEKVGIKSGRSPFIDEPVAAYLHHLNTYGVSTIEEKKVLVFDFGAGTCDICVFEISNRDNKLQINNLAISRNGEVGGDQLDYQIVDKVLWTQFVKQNPEFANIDRSIKKIIYSGLKNIAETLKIRLCDRAIGGDVVTKNGAESISNFEDFYISERISKGVRNASLSYKELYEIMSDFMLNKTSLTDNIATTLETAMIKSGINYSEIDEVVLIGGSCKNPYIEYFLKQIFPHKTQIVKPLDMQYAVSNGAAIHSLAMNVFGQNLITPVLGESLYVRINESTKKIFAQGLTLPNEGIMMPILPEQCLNGFEMDILIGEDKKLLKRVRQPQICGEAFDIVISISQDKLVFIEFMKDKEIISPVITVNPTALVSNSFASEQLNNLWKKYNQDMCDFGKVEKEIEQQIQNITKN